jgi:hypothetical protein
LGLPGGGAVVAALDKGVEAGNEGLDVGGEVSDFGCKAPNRFGEGSVSFSQGAEDLLDFEALLADAEVELSESLSPRAA